MFSSRDFGGDEITAKYLLCRNVRSMSASKKNYSKIRLDVGVSVTSGRFSAERRTFRDPDSINEETDFPKLS